ncbi:class I SAM-dependent methyltransferase [Candidatus Tisiphia endosymbiont of Micropterix aruncella]|uniref:class I SAM-dependent methyltransferase n=1 Tax=Candidatus Tisiphia endosymbiont of Micropterix aruncella TaxID=3066271 RepID=UPI003AA7C106
MSKILKISCIWLIVLCKNYELYAAEYSFKEAINKYYDLKLLQPKEEDDGRIQTLNKKGAMSPRLDEVTKKFIEFSKNRTVLEIGGAYGKAMIETLKKQYNVIYHLNDLDERHLFIAAYNIETLKLNQSTLDKIKFISGDITSTFKTGDKYDAILIARVLHFFSPEQLDNAVANIFSLLKDRGRVYVLAITPYVKRFESFIPEYEKRVLNKEPFPGYVQSLKDWVNIPVTNSNQLASIRDEPFMFLDQNVLTSIFKKHNFRIIGCKVVGLEYKSKSWSLDGRENVILIAEKLSN